MSIALVPQPVPLKGIDLENATREELRRALGLVVTLNAPTWREVMFMGRPVAFKVPHVPDGVAGRIGAVNADDFAQDEAGLAALKIAETLQRGKPRGTFRRSAAPGKPLPVAHGGTADWERSVFLAAAGPEVIPLLVAAGYLTASDVDDLSAVYPEGIEAQRIAATEATAALTHAAARSGTDPDLPEWINGQILTLMGEERPVDVFQEIYARQPEPNKQGPAVGSRSKIAEQMRPNPGIGEGTS